MLGINCQELQVLLLTNDAKAEATWKHCTYRALNPNRIQITGTGAHACNTSSPSLIKIKVLFIIEKLISFVEIIWSLVINSNYQTHLNRTLTMFFLWIRLLYLKSIQSKHMHSRICFSNMILYNYKETTKYYQI